MARLALSPAHPLPTQPFGGGAPPALPLPLLAFVLALCMCSAVALAVLALMAKHGGGVHKIAAEDDAAELDAHFAEIQRTTPIFFEYLGGDGDGDGCWQVGSHVKGHTLDFLRAVVANPATYTAKMGARTGWDLRFTLCKTAKDQSWLEAFNDVYFLGKGSFVEEGASGLKLVLSGKLAFILTKYVEPHMVNRWVQANAVLADYDTWANMSGGSEICPKPVEAIYIDPATNTTTSLILSSQHEAARYFGCSQTAISMSFRRSGKRTNGGDRISNPVPGSLPPAPSNPAAGRTAVKVTFQERVWTEARYKENFFKHAGLAVLLQDLKWMPIQPLPHDALQRLQRPAYQLGFWNADGTDSARLSVSCLARGLDLDGLSWEDLTEGCCRPQLSICQSHLQPLKMWSVQEGAPAAGGTGATGCAFYGPYNRLSVNGTTHTIHEIRWTGEAAMAKLRSWRAAVLAGGMAWRQTEKHALVDNMLTLDECRNSSFEVRAKAALRVERYLRAMHA